MQWNAGLACLADDLVADELPDATEPKAERCGNDEFAVMIRTLVQTTDRRLTAYRDGATPTWCGSGGQPPADGVAVPVAGTWSDSHSEVWLGCWMSISGRPVVRTGGIAIGTFTVRRPADANANVIGTDWP